MDLDIASHELLVAGVVAVVYRDAVPVVRSRLAQVGHVDTVDVCAAPEASDISPAEDCGVREVSAANYHQNIAMQSHPLRWTMVLVLLLTVHIADTIDVCVAAEASAIAVRRDDPTAIGDDDLAAWCAHR